MVMVMGTSGPGVVGNRDPDSSLKKSFSGDADTCTYFYHNEHQRNRQVPLYARIYMYFHVCIFSDY